MPRSLFHEIAAPRTAVMIGARTEHLRISKSPNALAKGRATWIEHLGDRNHLHLQVGESEGGTLPDPDAELGVGEELPLEIVDHRYFHGAGKRVNAEERRVTDGS